MGSDKKLDSIQKSKYIEFEFNDSRAVHLDQKKICKFCGKSYKKIAQHITEVHGSNQVKCTQCEEQFVSKRFLKRHTEVHHRTKVIPTVKTNHRKVSKLRYLRAGAVKLLYSL